MNDQENNWFGAEAATFGDRVAGAREAAGMSQSQLARRLGVKKTTLMAWEQDLSEPRANRLSMMAGLLDVSIMWLLTGEGDGTLDPIAVDEAVLDFSDVLTELREIRTSMRANAERAARLEKKLHRLVRQAAE
ncbi:helix-turn-helix domain-containing protein [Pontibaca salina]|uniref:Helix-turn-helix domain-containing protein n=1 Tax=Pontibaca salina TaxID=2795731 RepID=A0A934HNL2_9RHOB|nr:helix-turn-helix domain-containing protein [Pontibaca salina]MBI6628892.1 helix-turn-helix domain-containing protein [Pontibaca salina]